MDKKHYYFKLIPPRPSFPRDMTAEEKAVMQRHSAYFGEQFEPGKLLLYGPVMAPGGAFGLGILEVEDEKEARRFGENDPSVPAGLNRFELCPMPGGRCPCQRLAIFLRLAVHGDRHEPIRRIVLESKSSAKIIVAAFQNFLVAGTRADSRTRCGQLRPAWLSYLYMSR
jgi:uncharacterized protein YciI